MRDKIRTATESLWPDLATTLDALLTKIPGRCIRQRWGSLDEVEEFILARLVYLEALFVAIFGRDGEGRPGKRRRPPPKGPGADEQAKWQEDQKNYRLPYYLCVSTIYVNSYKHLLEYRPRTKTNKHGF